VTQKLFNITFTLKPQSSERNETCNLDVLREALRDHLFSTCVGTTCRIILAEGGFNSIGQLRIDGRASERCLEAIRDDGLFNFTAGPCGLWEVTEIFVPPPDYFSDNIEFLSVKDSGYLGSNIEALYFSFPLSITAPIGKVLIVVPESLRNPVDVCNLRARIVDGNTTELVFADQAAVRVPTNFATFGDLFNTTLLGTLISEDIRERLAKIPIEALIRQTCADLRNNTDTDLGGLARVIEADPAVAANDTGFLPLCRAKWNPRNSTCPLNSNCPADQCYYCGSVESCVRPSFERRDVCSEVADVFAGVNLQEACCEHDMCFVVAANKADLQRCNLAFSQDVYAVCKTDLCERYELLGVDFFCEATCRTLSASAYSILTGAVEIDIDGQKSLGLQREYNGLCDCESRDGSVSLPLGEWVVALDEDAYDVVANCSIEPPVCGADEIICNNNCVASAR
jgi:hypothetical protein